MKFIIGFVLGTAVSAMALQKAVVVAPTPEITRLDSRDNLKLSAGDWVVCAVNPEKFVANKDSSLLYVDYKVPKDKSAVAVLAFRGSEW